MKLGSPSDSKKIRKSSALRLRSARAIGLLNRWIVEPTLTKISVLFCSGIT